MASAIVPDLTDSPACLRGTRGINFVKAAHVKPHVSLCLLPPKEADIAGDKIKNPDGAFAINLYSSSSSDTWKGCSRVSGGL